MKYVICDACGNQTLTYKITSNTSTAGICMCDICLDTRIESPKERNKMTIKPRIHRAIIPSHSDEGSNYTGGIIQHPCGVSLIIEYDSKEKSWQIYNDAILSDKEIYDFLEALYTRIPEMFSDEEEISFGTLLFGQDGIKEFWDTDGLKWMLSDKIGYCIGINKDGFPNGMVRLFDMKELVYVYPYSEDVD